MQHVVDFTLDVDAYMFHRYTCSASVTGASYASGKEFGYGIVTKILRKHLEQMGKVLSTTFPPLWTDQNYINVEYDILLDRLLMFVTYCAQELKCNVRS